ncbi:MAG: DNA primase [Prevotella sp.]|nr:DNA primase [Prevotella sp.]
MIDRATVDKIIDAARIVDVVGEFVTLKKAGVNYKGLCPFHDDRNPSFMVSPAKNICHCFVCGKGGTPAGFLMEHEQITYPEALRWLAKKYNIEIVEKELTDEERAQLSERESMFIINEWARDWFHDTLKNEPDGIAIGKQYFRSRGIRDDIIEKFQLGYSPQKRDALSSAAIAKGYKKEFLVKTGLCFERDNNAGSQQPTASSQLVDRYSGRAIFPWLNVSGKVVAFGGRVLDSRTKGVAQKYVNSPDSDIYHKERELYGIYQAKKAIVKEDRVFMVEGYTDVIAMHQAGVENVVANSGTALSVYQIRLLHRFTSNITLLYDGDEAGIHAAMRGTDMLLAEGMNIKVLLLPDGDDPDSFARKHSTEQLKRYIDEHQTDFITFKSRLSVENVSDPVKRSEGISGIVKSISVIPDQILRSTYISDFAHRIGMKEQTLIAEMNKYIRRDLDEKAKERERAERRMSPQPADAAPPDQPPVYIPGEGFAEPQQPATPALHSPQEQASQVEMLLVREIVRHGDEVIFDNIQTDDGGVVSLTVAQYIDFDLSQDGISFSSPLYNQILAEAVAHQGEEGWKAEPYFCSHPDLQVSQLATTLAIDRHQLGRRFVIKPREGSLCQRVVHLVMDYRLDLVDARLKDIQRQLQQVGSDMGMMMKLLKEHKETKELRDALAKRLGSDLIV